MNGLQLQVFEGGDSDNECSGGFGSTTVRPKGNTKVWTRSLQLGNEDQPHKRSTTVENGMFNTNITGRGRSSPWGEGRKSPPMSTPQPDKNNSDSHVKPRVSTSSSKRTSLWGLSAVRGFNFTSFLLLCLSSCGGGNVCRHL